MNTEKVGLLRRAARGSVLVMTLVAVLITGVITGAMCQYYVSGSRLIERFYLEKDRERDRLDFARQLIHETIGNIMNELSNVTSDLVGVPGRGVNAKALADKLSQMKKFIKVDDQYSVSLRYEGIDEIRDNLALSGSEVLTIESTLKKEGGVVAVYVEQIEFYVVGSQVLTTLPLFDYVYFAYNYGHLYPSSRTKLVVNGDVHSNGKFDIENAVINGFISASNGVTVSNSKAWPYKTYKNNVQSRYNQVLTQVRPTNPTWTNETARTGVEWLGGYEPVMPTIGSYPTQPPTKVEDGVLGDEPIQGKGKYAYPDTPEPKQGEGEYSYTKIPEPKKGEGEFAYPDTPEPKQGEGEFAYAGDPEPIQGQGKYAYPDTPEPIQGEGIYAYTSAPEPIQGEGIYAYPNTPEPIQGEGIYAYPNTAEPKKGQGEYAYGDEPKQGQGKYAYPNTAEPKKGEGQYAYGDEPKKGEGKYAYTYTYYKNFPYKKGSGDFAYPTKPSCTTSKKNGKTYYNWTYTTLAGQKLTQSTTEKKAEPFKSQYEADKKTQDAAYEAAKKEWESNGKKLPTDKEAKDAAWQTAHAAWEADCKAKDAACEKAHDAWQKARDDKDAEWETAHAAWKADCEAKDAACEKAHEAWQKARDDKDAAWKKDHDAWQKARDDKDAQWKKDHDAWLEAGGDDRPAKDALWKKDHDAWQKVRDDLDALWEKDHDAWVKASDSDREAKDKAWEAAYAAWKAARKAKDDAWKAAHDFWLANNGTSLASKEEQDAKWKVAHDAWQKARDDKDDEWKKDHDAWLVSSTEYEKQHAAYLKYLEDYKAWEQARDAWIAAQQTEIDNGTREVDITTAACTVMTNSLIVSNAVSIFMPNINPTTANIEKYRKYCQEYQVSSNQVGGTLICWNINEDGSRIALTNICERRVTYRGIGSTYGNQTLAYEESSPRKLAQVKIVNGSANGSGYAGYPFEYEKGSTFESLKSIEAKSVILIGTKNKPIEINGPVFIDGDVLIRGIVRGRGSIYASRNIHIIGDLIYENPPTWPSSRLLSPSEGPDKVAAANESRDLLALIAMKSIVVGDYTSANWQSQQNMQYLTAYNVNDGGKKVDVTITDSGWDDEYMMGNGKLHILAAKALGISEDHCLSSDQLRNKFPTLYNEFGYTRYVAFAVNRVTATATTASTRKYYETMLGNYIVSSFQPTTPPRSLRDKLLGLTPDPAGEIFADAHDITQIDGILYANNGIIGEVGGSKKHQFTLNGAMICADECLFPSFNSRFANAEGDTPTIWLNWDLRIRSDAKGGLRVGMEEDYRNTTSSMEIKMRVLSWQQIQ